jgi:hypothetical protein
MVIAFKCSVNPRILPTLAMARWDFPSRTPGDGPILVVLVSVNQFSSTAIKVEDKPGWLLFITVARCPIICSATVEILVEHHDGKALRLEEKMKQP